MPPPSPLSSVLPRRQPCAAQFTDCFIFYTLCRFLSKLLFRVFLFTRERKGESERERREKKVARAAGRKRKIEKEEERKEWQLELQQKRRHIAQCGSRIPHPHPQPHRHQHQRQARSDWQANLELAAPPFSLPSLSFSLPFSFARRAWEIFQFLIGKCSHELLA